MHLRRLRSGLLYFLHFLTTALACAVLSPSAAAEASSIRASFLHGLSRFSGPVPYQWIRLCADPESQEVLVADRQAGSVDIYDHNGMEVFSFSAEGTSVTLQDLVVEEAGNILLLIDRQGLRRLIRCDYRGEVLLEFAITGLPPELEDFSPDRLASHNGRIFLAEQGRKRIVAAEADGTFRQWWRVGEILGLAPQDDEEVVLEGFSIDLRGRMLFTIPLLFSAYRFDPQSGEARPFGQKGSAPGKFGVIGDVVSDRRGLVFVADVLRCVVLTFDEDLQFIGEFGHRGFGPSNLIGPRHLAVDSGGLVYVSQLRGRGISVYRVEIR